MKYLNSSAPVKILVESGARGLHPLHLLPTVLCPNRSICLNPFFRTSTSPPFLQQSPLRQLDLQRSSLSNGNSLVLPTFMKQNYEQNGWCLENVEPEPLVADDREDQNHYKEAKAYD